MLKDFQEKIKSKGLDKTKKVLLAVSGGVDSMVLWELFHKSGIPYQVAHVNFSLRGKESEFDEEFVKEKAEAYQANLKVKQVDTNQYAKKHKVSIQMAAREIRYQWFDELMKQHSIDFLVTAHHLDDSFESFLINLNRGTGLKGLLGITEKLNILRPLLSYSKEQIVAFAAENEIEFREDGSNSSLKYERNWFRHEMISKWKKHNPEILKSMQHTFSRLKSAEELLNDFLQTETAALQKQLKQKKLAITDVLNLRHPQESLYFLLSTYGLKEDQLVSMYNCIREKQIGKIFYTNEYQFVLDRDFVFIEENQNREDLNSTFIEVNQLELKSPKELFFKTFSRSKFKFGEDENTEAFDFEKLDFPLEFRKWREGDWMIPLGMKGKKKVSDILIDEKVPIHLKESVFVICSNNNIICLLNYRIDNRFKIDDQTEKVFQIKST